MASNIIKNIMRSSYNSSLQRMISWNNGYAGNRTYKTVAVAKKEMDIFQGVLPTIIKQLVTHPRHTLMPGTESWINKLIDYNVTDGKLYRGLTTILSYEMTEKPENVTEECMKLAAIMGWCVEMFQAYLLMSDDIIDQSVTRRNKPCWFRLPNVGLQAINDSDFLLSLVYCTLEIFFADKPYYKDVLHCFFETTTCTSVGENLDIQTSNNVRKKDFSGFTMSRFETISKLKTSYYAFRLPVFLGLFMADQRDPHMLKQVEQVCMDIGIGYQFQNDFMDCFSEKIGKKIGNDITEGKCSWLAVAAFERCSAAQRSVFTACYGSADTADVQRVKQLYEELRLPELYAEEEKRFYNRIKHTTSQWPDSMAPIAALCMKVYEINKY